MRQFIDTLPDKELRILDLGCRIVEGQESLGSYRDLITNPKWTYWGADVSIGSNVDTVISAYMWPWKDNEFDIVISGQTIEHIEYPWVWFKEMARVLKKGGKCCIIAPAKIGEHKFPIDTYRYYPDGMRALAKWAGLEPVDIQRVVANKHMEDTYLIAQK